MSYLNLFKDKRVIVTGHTGFKGSWLISWLKLLGSEVVGIADGIPTSPSNYEISSMKSFIKNYKVDIRDMEKIKKIITSFKPDFIFHLAAQALVKKSYKDQLETLSTNAIGSASLLESLLNYRDKLVVIMITSDKVYDNKEWLWGYRENDELGGHDPYSISKTMAELAIKSYLESSFSRENTNIKIGIGRAGNVIGGGDWAEDRIVPDCVKAWSKNKILEVRNPMSTRPWQHVLEPLSGYLKLAYLLDKSGKFHGSSYNFGPAEENNYSVKELIEEMSKYWNKSKWNDVSNKKSSFKESSLLKLNCEKSFRDLQWRPTLNFRETVSMTINWYKYYHEKNISMKKYNEEQIIEYQKKLLTH